MEAYILLPIGYLLISDITPAVFVYTATYILLAIVYLLSIFITTAVFVYTASMTNVALGKTVTASAQYSGDTTAYTAAMGNNGIIDYE